MMETETINFYGLERYNRAGKHPSEFMSEGEVFERNNYGDLHGDIVARANALSDLWGMPVTGYYQGTKERAI